MADVEHKDITPEHQHPIVRWTWANSAARLAQAVTADDVHKVGYQTSDATYWFLSDDSPVTWNSLTGTWAQVLANGVTSGAYNPTIDSGQYLQFAGEVTIKRNGADVITTDADETRIFGHAAGSSVTYWIEATKFATMGVAGGFFGFLSFTEAYEGLITMDPRATNNAGRNLRIVAGNAGPVGDLDAGSIFIQPGARNGAGEYGAVNIGSEDSVVRIALNSDRDVVLNGLATVQVQINDLDIVTFQYEAGGAPDWREMVLHTGDTGSDQFQLRVSQPGTNVSGSHVGIFGADAGAGGGSANGGKAFLQGGLRNASGSDGSTELRDSAGIARVSVLGGDDKDVDLNGELKVNMKVAGNTIAYVNADALHAIGLIGESGTGDLFLHADPASWQSGEKVVFIGDCDVVPTAGESGGGFLYSEAGALKWRGPSGAITPMGAA